MITPFKQHNIVDSARRNMLPLHNVGKKQNNLEEKSPRLENPANFENAWRVGVEPKHKFIVTMNVFAWISSRAEWLDITR